MTQTTSSSRRWMMMRKKDNGRGGLGGGSKRELTKHNAKPSSEQSSSTTSSRLRNLMPMRGGGNSNSNSHISHSHHNNNDATATKPSSTTVKSRKVRTHKADKHATPSGRSSPTNHGLGDSSSSTSSESTAASTTSRRKDLFYFDSAVASADELGLKQIDEGAAADHVSLVWSKDMLTSAQKKFYHAQGLSSKHIPSHLYLSDRHVACDRALLEKLEVEFIVNCTHSTPCLFEQEMNSEHMDRFRYHRVPLSDDSSENLMKHLPHAVAFMNDLRSSELFEMHSGVVLVHCSWGISRSASVVVGWMMSTLGMPVLEALRLVCGRRAIAKPQPIFLRQLLDLERQLFGKHNVSLKERDLDACIVCLEESFLVGKEELECGHVCCASCFSTGITQCTLCAYASKNPKANRRRS